MTASRNTTTAVAAVKLGVFVLASLLVTGLLAAIMGSFGFGSQDEYRAVFSSASMLEEGDDVRVAGVSVGEVTGVEIKDRNDAEVTFEVKSDVPLTEASRAEIRYLNLVGARYMSLSQGSQGSQGGGRLPDGATIPKSRTTPALNLTELFNGFQPLFQALTPEDVNALAANLIAVFQGEGGTIKSLLNQVGSLSNTLANRDQLIASVINNLTRTLETVDGRHEELGELLTSLNTWMSDLADDKDVIGDSVGQVAEMADELATLLIRVRPHAKADIAELRRVLLYLNRPENQAFMSETINRLPTTLRRQARIGSHGSWYNYYLCDFDGKITLPSLGPTLDNAPVINEIRTALSDLAVYSTADRCTP